MSMKKCCCRCDEHRILLPPEVIEALSLAPDAEVEFQLSDDGEVVIRNTRGVVPITDEMIDSLGRIL